MSFAPLPIELVRDLDRAAGAPIVELGCGEGRLTRCLRTLVPGVIGLDLQPFPTGIDIVADALIPPLRPASIAVIVQGNLFRHLDDGLRGLDAWRTALTATGTLWILEDEPDMDDGPGALYRDLQRCLDDLVPQRRGALMSPATFRNALSSESGWTFGRVRNREASDSLHLLLNGLDAWAGTTPEAARIAAAIRADGLDYGHYWWARWSVEDTS